MLISPKGSSRERSPKKSVRDEASGRTKFVQGRLSPRTDGYDREGNLSPRSQRNASFYGNHRDEDEGESQWQERRG